MPGRHLHVAVRTGVATAIVGSMAMAVASAPPPSDNEIAKADEHSKPVAQAESAPTAAAEMPVGKRSGEVIYKMFCESCHEEGIAGAPKLGDMAAWAPRLDLGVYGLMTSVRDGKNAMPAGGAITDATDAELRRAVIFMANKSGANFKSGDQPRILRGPASGRPASP